MDKEDKKLEADNNQENNNDNKKEDKNKNKAVVPIIAILLLIILTLLILFGLKNCKGCTASPIDLSSSKIKDEDDLDNKFKKIVNKEREFGGLEESVNKVIAITYIDNYPNNFSINITAASNNYLYHYELNDYSYPLNKDGYEDMVSYILSIDISNRLDGGVLNTTIITNEKIINDKEAKYIVSTNEMGNIKYLSGYYLKDNEYHIYNKKIINSENPFNELEDQLIKENNQLFNYYQSLEQL